MNTALPRRYSIRRVTRFSRGSHRQTSSPCDRLWEPSSEEEDTGRQRSFQRLTGTTFTRLPTIPMMLARTVRAHRSVSMSELRLRKHSKRSWKNTSLFALALSPWRFGTESLSSSATGYSDVRALDPRRGPCRRHGCHRVNGLYPLSCCSP